tara:strand:- start:10201 stop:10620 length:420 start_codon:yes stop_codon:yes gene_type:complete
MSVKRNKFFAKPDVAKERIEICRSCEHYFKPTGTCGICGCFMRIKSKIGAMSCADVPKKWLSTGDYYAPTDIPEDLIKEVMEIFPKFENRKAPDYQTKENMIELFNVIHGTAHSLKTNCSSCLSQIWNSFNTIYNANKK